MNGLYKMAWGDTNDPWRKFYLTFNEASRKGPHFTFTLSVDRRKRMSYFVIGVAKRFKVINW